MTHPYPAPLPAPVARATRPKAPGATLALTLGILAVAGTFVLVVPVFLAPLAWYHGTAAARRVEREPDRWTGGSEARSGQVLGLIGSVLMVVVLGVLLLAALGTQLASGYDAGYGT
ncbi:MAG: hypothetical protein ABWX74_15445 [Aeromicrobium sp.]